MDTNVFVNPYTFVPLPQAVHRHAPHGHDVAALPDGTPLLSGTIDVRWTLHTPLLLPTRAREEVWLRSAGSQGDDLAIPGSAMKGVLRSVHEALFGGCVRVVDDGFVPVYREPARPRGQQDGWVLAVVATSEAGHPRELRLCADTAWVDGWSLHQAWGKRHLPDVPTSGDVLAIAATPRKTELRSEFRDVTSVRRVATSEIDPPAGARALLVTGTGARKKTRRVPARDGRPPQVVVAGIYWATGAITDEVVPLTEDAWKTFEREAAGTHDRRRLVGVEGREHPDWRTSTPTELVRWRRPGDSPMQGQERAIARRKRSTGYLHVGDVVWAHVGPTGDSRVVDRLALSAIWREGGAGPVNERLPRSTQACHDADRLCLSCEVFGSADTTGERQGRGEQDGYRGHVRVGGLRSTSVARPQLVDLAPLGSPRLGTGNFSLTGERPTVSRGQRPGHWDVPPGERRMLRGRKFYWHSDPAEQQHRWHDEGVLAAPFRYERRPGQTDKLSADEPRLLWPAGAVLTQRIVFSGLTGAALLSVLLCIDPTPLLGSVRPGHGGFALRMGGGKPLGLGSVSAEMTCSVTTVAGRYRPGDPVPIPTVASHCGALIQRIGTGVLSSTAPGVARVLDRRGLGEWVNHVWYPPGADWTQAGSEAFDESYRFFANNDGEQLRDSSKPYETLPDVLADPPTLPVAPENGHSQ